jgi:hypothetical protein
VIVIPCFDLAYQLGDALILERIDDLNAARVFVRSQQRRLDCLSRFAVSKACISGEN